MFLRKNSPYSNTTIRFIEEFNIWNKVTEFYKGGLDVINKMLFTRVEYIDYYMLRAWYRFYSRVLIPYRERASLRASELYGIKNEWIKMIWLLTCNNLFITYYMLCFSCRVLVFVLFEKLRKIFIGDIHKSWRSHFIDKTVKQFFPPKLMPGARCQLKYNVQPDWSNQIITVYLIGQFKPWSDMISFHCSEMISYHFTVWIVQLNRL